MGTSGNIMDPFEAEQEKDKWMRKATFWLVMFIRFIVYVITLILKIIISMIKGVMMTFGIMPKR